MSDAAAFSACYSDFKLVRTRKCVQIIFEIPSEQASLALDILGGMPRVDADVWCGIARLEKTSGGAVESGGANAPASPKVIDLDKRLAQRAGILCADPVFRRFLDESVPDGDPFTEESAATYLRVICSVKSRSEIKPGTYAAEKFDELLNQFAGWKAGLQ